MEWECGESMGMLPAREALCFPTQGSEVLWVRQQVGVLCAHPSSRPCLTSRDVPDGSLVPQFTLLQAGTQGKPAAPSPSSDRGDAWPHPAHARRGQGLWEPVWVVQATLQSDPFYHGLGTHSTPQEDSSAAPACGQFSGPSLQHAVETPQAPVDGGQGSVL